MSRTLQICRETFRLLSESGLKKSVGRPSFLIPILNKYRGFDALFEVLADEKSRDVLEWIIRIRIAHSQMSLADSKLLFPPEIKDEEWQHLLSAASAAPDYMVKDDLRDVVEIWNIDTYQIPGIFEVREGDFVIDGGAYTGNSTIWYSKLVGETGQVYSFEASPPTFGKLRDNVARYCPNNSKCYNYALLKQNAVVKFQGDGPGAHLSGEGEYEVQGDSVDNLVNHLGIPRVDMIKLDVEGAEPEVLEGCQTTIRKFKPKMAVCIYHKADDILKIPAIVQSMDPNYRIYLRSQTNDESNITMFFVPTDDPSQCNLEEALSLTTPTLDPELSGYIFELLSLLDSTLVSARKNFTLERQKRTLLEKRVLDLNDEIKKRTAEENV